VRAGAPPLALALAAGASAKVFQASQAGQRPSQRNDSWPHAEQKKTDRTFAMKPS
jgi:hypothetical protein